MSLLLLLLNQGGGHLHGQVLEVLRLGQPLKRVESTHPAVLRGKVIPVDSNLIDNLMPHSIAQL